MFPVHRLFQDRSPQEYPHTVTDCRSRCKERSTIPNGMLRHLRCLLCNQLADTGNLKCRRLIVSQSSSKILSTYFFQSIFYNTRSADSDIDDASASVTPWKAPAINGLSSGALQNTTSLAQPRESCLFGCLLLQEQSRPSSFTASILIPVFVEANVYRTAYTLCTASACGNERIRSSSAVVIPLVTRAEYPPIKFTPTVLLHDPESWRLSQNPLVSYKQAPPNQAIGVTEIRLFTIGIP